MREPVRLGIAILVVAFVGYQLLTGQTDAASVISILVGGGSAVGVGELVRSKVMPIGPVGEDEEDTYEDEE